MKDKEKQIEEMAKIIKDNSIIDVTYGGKPYADDYENLARKLLEHYQPKLPEDSVVLSREEYEDLQVGKDFDYGYHEGYKNTEAYYENFKLPEERKETAEKIIDLIKTFCPDKKFVEVITRIISERFGVEIKE